jgi:hypothetical protein
MDRESEFSEFVRAGVLLGCDLAEAGHWRSRR